LDRDFDTWFEKSTRNRRGLGKEEEEEEEEEEGGKKVREKE